jgi:hypothetical protein
MVEQISIDSPPRRNCPHNEFDLIAALFIKTTPIKKLDVETFGSLPQPATPRRLKLLVFIFHHHGTLFIAL